MAQKRMYSLAVCDTDKFLDMPPSAQALYFHLGLHADDDGFVSSPKKIKRAAGCADNDLSKLIDLGYIILFESGVVVITDWHINNVLKTDRYRATIYQEELGKLSLDESGRYRRGSTLDPLWNQSGTKVEPQYRIEENSIVEQRGGEGNPPCVEELTSYAQKHGLQVDCAKFWEYYNSRGWYAGKNYLGGGSWREKLEEWAATEWKGKKAPAANPAPAGGFDLGYGENDTWTL